MAIEVNRWTPGTTYPPGSVVRPTFVGGHSQTPPDNPDFETGNFTGWTPGSNWTVVGTVVYSGSFAAKLAAGAGTSTLINNLQAPVVAGQKITANAYFNFNGNSLGSCSFSLTLTWYDSGHSVVSTSSSTPVLPLLINPSSWIGYFFDDVAPATAAFVSIGVSGTNGASNPTYVDNFYWDYALVPSAIPQLFYAVQTGTGKSGATEPAWAVTPPDIFDGTVEWSSQIPTSITWFCEALLESGVGEPIWPTIVGHSVHDGFVGSGVDWLAITPQVVDPNDSTLPPASPYVMIASSKIFVANTDIVNFCATVNPLDWTTEGDAGYLPTGLQTYGGNPFQALGLYRSNGLFFNSQGLQMWQLDEDPANMTLLEALPIGCTRHRAGAPVNNDWFFLAAQGVRTMGISAGAGNLQAGDIGMPIDPLVQAAVAYADANSLPQIGTYFPSAGQYWLGFPNYQAAAGTFVNPPADGTGTTTIFVYTMSRVGEVGAWSRYVIPIVMQDFAQFGNDMYVRGLDAHGAQIAVKVVQFGTTDIVSSSTATAFPGIIQWPWLDDGQPGATKQLVGVDFVVTMATGSPSYTFQVGYDQSDTTAFTATCTLAGDTVPGFIIPMAMMAPTFSLRMTMDSATGWQVQAAMLYLQDERLTS